VKYAEFADFYDFPARKNPFHFQSYSHRANNKHQVGKIDINGIWKHSAQKD